MTQPKWWMRTLILGTLAAGSLGLAGADALAQTPVTGTDPDFPRGKISGYVFGDYYYNVSGDPGHSYNASGADTAKVNLDGSPYANGQPKVIGRDLNGIQVRRVYFQHDADLSVKYSTRVRLEADGKSLTSDGKVGLAVRNAYLQVKNILPRTMFQFGILSTPIWESTDEIYGYRPIEKSIADFRGLGSSSDLGVALKGFVDDAHRVGFNAMLGNGLGNKPEDNRYKKLYLSMPLKVTDALRLEPFVDYEWGPNGADKATFKAFAWYELRRGALGAEVVDRVNHSRTSANKEPFGLSFFGRYKAHEKATIFGRYDRFQPNTRAANRIDSDLYVAGIDWEPYKDVHVMPNIEAAQYRARGTADAPPHHDVQARMTFYFKFAKP
ncbi:MAG TPA: hypothetical protein VI198_04305 [Candidatus Eisenbacteria bacterium]